MSKAYNCSVCGEECITPYFWALADDNIKLPSPPADLTNSIICNSCYKDGETMEERIRSFKNNGRIQMPDGTDGYKCMKCGVYFPYVEANIGINYICFKCR